MLTLLDLYYFLAVTTEAWLESKVAALWYLAVQRIGSKVSFQDCSNETYCYCPDFRVQWKEMWPLMTSCSTTRLDQTSRCFGGWAWRWRRARRWPWWAAAAAGRARSPSSWSGSMTPWLAQWWAHYFLYFFVECSVSFRCTTKQFSYAYTYIHTFFRFFTHTGCYRILSRVPSTVGPCQLSVLYIEDCVC